MGRHLIIGTEQANGTSPWELLAQHFIGVALKAMQLAPRSCLLNCPLYNEHTLLFISIYIQQHIQIALLSFTLKYSITGKQIAKEDDLKSAFQQHQ